MSNPQQPELARSAKTPAQDQDAVSGVVEGQRVPGADAPGGPVPPENQPGHHPATEQDKPDLNAFAAKLGTVAPSERRDVSPEPSRTRRVPSGVVAAVAAVLAVVVAVVAGRRWRSRRR
ncbi:MAG: hypothetical protein ACR2KK_16245 [Acidimicrobiales bacterium]